MSDSTHTPTPRIVEAEKDRSTVASETGFTGSLAEFIDWLGENLVYGELHVKEQSPASQNLRDEAMFRVETTTGGFSSDEYLLARAREHFLLAMHWSSSHSGGLTVYEFPKSWYQSPTTYEFLKPEAEGAASFQHDPATRRVRMHSIYGDVTDFSFPNGLELSYENTSGTLIIHQAAPTV